MLKYIKKFSFIFICIFILSLVLQSCCIVDSKQFEIEETANLPDNVELYISPKKQQYRPYEKVTVYFKVKNNGTFEKDLNIPQKAVSQIHLTPLTKVNGEFTYKVDWKNIHLNGHGYNGKTKYMTWYLNNNWNRIIPQTPGNYVIQFNLSTPVGNWYSPPISIDIRVAPEDKIPLAELLENDLHLFFEYEYVARMYNENWSTYKSCPRVRLPYEKVEPFVKKYPYFYLTKQFKTKLERTRKILLNEHTKYDVNDMTHIDGLLNILGQQ